MSWSWDENSGWTWTADYSDPAPSSDVDVLSPDVTQTLIALLTQFKTGLEDKLEAVTQALAELGASYSTPLAVGLDYSAGSIPGAVIGQAGYSFVLRYVDAPGNANPKCITPAEYQDLLAAGIDVCLVFEQNVHDMLGGSVAGRLNSQRALAGANWIGYDGPIFMACDMHLEPEQIPIAFDYIDSAAGSLGANRTGVYGFYELVDACGATGRGQGGLWQCGIAPAASDPVHIWQRNDGFVLVGGVECDVNELLKPLPSADTLTPGQDQMLAEVHSQTCGMWPAWPGGITDGAGSPYNVIEMVWTNNSQIHQANLGIQALQTKVESLNVKLDSLLLQQLEEQH